MRGRAGFLASLSFMIASGPAMAELSLPGWAAALMSGSDRLALYALGRSGVDDAAPVLTQLAYRTGGLHHGAGPQLVGRDLSARPLLYYATNFNGGIPADRITIAGLDFSVDDDARAKGGLAVGASVSGGLKFSYRQGSTLRLAFGASAETLAGEGLHRQEIGVSICAEHHLTGWTWLDACAGVGGLWRNYDDDTVQRSLSIGPTVLTSAGGLDQQIGVKATRTELDSGAQNGIRADWLGAVPDVGAIGLGASWAEELPGENARRRGLSASLARPVAGRPVTLSIDFSETGGSQVFGADRSDRTVRLGVDWSVNDTLDVDASVGRRNSTVDAYDETFATLNFDISRW